MLEHYPVVYISSVDHKVIDWDAFPMGREPNFFKGLELSLGENGARYEVDRVFITQISDTQPVIYVLVDPCKKFGFITKEAVAVTQNIYNHLASQELVEVSAADALGDAMAKKLESFKWN